MPNKKVVAEVAEVSGRVSADCAHLLSVATEISKDISKDISKINKMDSWHNELSAMRIPQFLPGPMGWR